MIVVFVLGYFLIAMEHPFKIDKAASALLTGVICWTILVFGQETILAGQHELLEQSQHFIEHNLLQHVGEISEILFFLLARISQI